MVVAVVAAVAVVEEKVVGLRGWISNFGSRRNRISITNRRIDWEHIGVVDDLGRINRTTPTTTPRTTPRTPLAGN